ncbi:MAG: hypothetical protein WDW38_008905 [Sanguina aurantia]
MMHQSQQERLTGSTHPKASHVHDSGYALARASGAEALGLTAGSSNRHQAVPTLLRGKKPASPTGRTTPASGNATSQSARSLLGGRKQASLAGGTAAGAAPTAAGIPSPHAASLDSSRDSQAAPSEGTSQAAPPVGHDPNPASSAGNATDAAGIRNPQPAPVMQSEHTPAALPGLMALAAGSSRSQAAPAASGGAKLVSTSGGVALTAGSSGNQAGHVADGGERPVSTSGPPATTLQPGKNKRKAGRVQRTVMDAEEPEAMPSRKSSDVKDFVSLCSSDDECMPPPPTRHPSKAVKLEAGSASLLGAATSPLKAGGRKATRPVAKAARRTVNPGSQTHPQAGQPQLTQPQLTQPQLTQPQGSQPQSNQSRQWKQGCGLDLQPAAHEAENLDPKSRTDVEHSSKVLLTAGGSSCGTADRNSMAEAEGNGSGLHTADVDDSLLSRPAARLPASFGMLGVDVHDPSVGLSKVCVSLAPPPTQPLKATARAPLAPLPQLVPVGGDQPGEPRSDAGPETATNETDMQDSLHLNQQPSLQASLSPPLQPRVQPPLQGGVSAPKDGHVSGSLGGELLDPEPTTRVRKEPASAVPSNAWICGGSCSEKQRSKTASPPQPGQGQTTGMRITPVGPSNTSPHHNHGTATPVGAATSSAAPTSHALLNQPHTAGQPQHSSSQPHPNSNLLLLQPSLSPQQQQQIVVPPQQPALVPSPQQPPPAAPLLLALDYNMSPNQLLAAVGPPLDQVMKRLACSADARVAVPETMRKMTATRRFELIHIYYPFLKANYDCGDNEMLRRNMAKMFALDE